MTDNYSQLKITSDSNKSFNMTKDDASVGMLGALVIVKQVGPYQGHWACTKVNPKSLQLCSLLMPNGKPAEKGESDVKFNMTYEDISKHDPPTKFLPGAWSNDHVPGWVVGNSIFKLPHAMSSRSPDWQNLWASNS